MLVVGVGLGAANGVLVQQRYAGGQDPAHPGLDAVGVQEGQRFPHAPPEVLLGRQAVDPLQRRVDHHVPQIGVQDGQPDRRLVDEPHGQRQVPLHPPQRCLIGGQPQGVQITAVVLQPHIAEFQQPRAAVLVPHGKTPAQVPSPSIT